MKQLVLSVLACLLIMPLGCKGDGDILAEYKDGTISRGEFFNWIEENHYRKESILKSKKKQKDMVNRMAIDRIAAIEAKRVGFDKDEDFKAVADMAIQNQLMKLLYKKEIKEKATFKKPALKISHIYFRVKDFKIEKKKRVKLNKAELDVEFEKIITKAKTIIKKIDDGEDFAKVAKQHSNDFSKKKGGDIGYRLKDQLPEDYAKIAFALEEGSYTKEPVKVYSEKPSKLPNGIYIIKVSDKVELTEDNIEDIIDNKVAATRMKNMLLRESAKDYVEQLKSEKDVKVNLDNAKSKDPKMVIFKISELVYTVGDLNKRIKLFRGRAGKMKNKNADITDKQRISLAESILRYELLKRIALRNGIDKDPEYIQSIELKRNTILAKEYVKKIGSGKVTVTDAEIRDEYAKNKDKRYYKMERKGKKREKVVEPFAKVKDRIEKILLNKKQSLSIRSWKKEIVKKYQLKIDESELEGK